MPLTLDQAKTNSTTEFDTRATTLQARQDAYAVTNGIYFQGLSTTNPYPTDGTEPVPDFSLQPTDQVSIWTPADFPATTPSTFWIDTYGTDGYICLLSFVFGTALWQKCIGYGSAVSLSHDWQDFYTEANIGAF